MYVNSFFSTNFSEKKHQKERKTAHFVLGVCRILTLPVDLKFFVDAFDAVDAQVLLPIA